MWREAIAVAFLTAVALGIATVVLELLLDDDGPDIQP